MILISVDLPAPLSPSKPSTSPLRRCRFTSRSAVTGPKRLAMCSTRRTSSGAELGGTIVAVTGSATAMSPPHTSHVHVRGHRHHHRETGVEQQIVRIDALQDQAILEDPEEDGAEDRKSVV